MKKQNRKFSLSFDEWTSLKNRRYLNLNVHIQNKFWKLGLVRVHGSLPAESCIKLIEERMDLFGLNVHEDVVCIATDGAAVMLKDGKLLCCEQQFCVAYGIHLAVLDVLYKKPVYKSVEEINDNNDSKQFSSNKLFLILKTITFTDESDSEDDSENSGIQIVEKDIDPELCDELYNIIVTKMTTSCKNILNQNLEKKCN